MDGEKVEGAVIPTVTTIENLALDVFEFFGGDIQWQAVPWVAELKGCDDLDTLCELLQTIRNHRAEAMRDA